MSVMGVFLPDYVDRACLRTLFPFFLLVTYLCPDIKVFEPVEYTVLMEVNLIVSETLNKSRTMGRV